jgi:DNA-binding NtrC family response regulator
MKRILVIDDDSAIREMLRELLTEQGYSVELAEDGEKAMELMQKDRFDLIITDIVMPEKDGISVIIHLMKQYPETKCLAMSGGGRISSKTYLNLADKLGASKTLEKPFELSEMLNAIVECLK